MIQNFSFQDLLECGEVYMRVETAPSQTRRAGNLWDVTVQAAGELQTQKSLPVVESTVVHTPTAVPPSLSRKW